MSKVSFSERLKNMRANAKLTNRGLARLAKVPESLISGLQNEKRRVGELQASRIGEALGLAGNGLKDFVCQAINTCTQRLLHEAKAYPAEVINFLPQQLKDAGISAESIFRCTVDGDSTQQSLTIWLSGDRQAVLRTELTLN
jgi:transcriptional regulator with XRE-family HTH domain